MMSRITAVIAVAGALFTQTSSVLLAQHAQEFTGVYYCEGTDASGTPYRGTTHIGKQKDAYYVHWTIAGHLTAVGIGVAKGNTLAVSYYGPSTGVVLYTRTDAGLTGEWTQPNAGGAIFSETLTRIPEQELHRRPLPSEKAPTPVPPGLPGRSA
jgi:hypothetical protein